jgi:hypothetical protein
MDNIKSSLNSGVADPHNFDADPDPTCHFGADPDPDPSFQLKAQNLENRLILPIRIDADPHADPDPAK